MVRDCNKEDDNKDSKERENKNDAEFIKIINKNLQGNAPLKNVFKNIKFDGSNGAQILDLIEQNREELIIKTFQYKQDMYANYCNTRCLLKKPGKCCRILGYYVDVNKKGKSLGYGFNKNNYTPTDIVEFDFIPFAFIGKKLSIFINDNYEINRLTSTKETLSIKLKNYEDDLALKNRSISGKGGLFRSLLDTVDFIEYDVEVILKDSSNKYFETLFIRRKSLNIMKTINQQNINFTCLGFSLKITDSYRIDVYSEVINAILNNLNLDDLIETFLRTGKFKYIVKQLSRINNLIRGGATMNYKSAEKISEEAKKVASKIPKNKVESYRCKLITALLCKDYDDFCEILIQLSQYCGINFSFSLKLLANFEANKNIAYIFVNDLVKEE